MDDLLSSRANRYNVPSEFFCEVSEGKSRLHVERQHGFRQTVVARTGLSFSLIMFELQAP